MRVFLLLLLATVSPALASEKEAEKETWDVNAPPGEAATVPIDTRTGTWMSVDVSPDGETLVFDLLGDLYTLPIEGGEATALTHSIAWEMQPRFSPDGTQILYMSDEGGGDNAWVVGADGKDARAVTDEDFRLVNNPVWHPDGEYIAVRKHFTGTRSLGTGEIWLYHISGGTKGVALNEKVNWQKDLGEPAFSPDGRHVYFSQDTTPGRFFEYNKNSHDEIYDIQRLDLDDGTIEPFVTGPGGAVRPVPSPDGRWLAFVRRVRGQSTLFVKDLRTGEERPVWDRLERDLQETWAVHGVYPAFAWLPGSREIVVWARGGLWRVQVPGGEAREIPFHVKDTREIREAVRFEVPVAPERFDVKQLRWATVSPGGDTVVYSALGSLYIRDLPAGTPRRLTSSADRLEFYPSFSRDGERVVFVAWSDEDLGSVRVIDLDTGGETTLTRRPGRYLEPRFSPDGRSVVFSEARGGYLTPPWVGLDPGVYRVASDGSGAPERVTRSGFAPQFGAEDDRLFVTRRSYKEQSEITTTLVEMDLTGGHEREVVKTEKATEFAVSPDGQWLAFVEGFQAYVLPFPRTGRLLEVGPQAESLPRARLSVDAGEYLHWSGDSRRVHFVLGDELFTREVEEVFRKGADAEEDVEGGERGLEIGFVEDADRPTATVALVGARLVTMRGEEVIEDGTVIVQGNTIAALGRRGEVSVPPGATVVDVAGKTIVPGLVDAHWHGSMGDGEIIPQQSWIDYASLAFGVTTLFDPSNDPGTIFTQAEMQRAGLIVAPRIFSTGSVLYGAKATITATVNSLEDALAHVKRTKAGGATAVKSYNQPRRDQRQQILEAARQTGMLVVPEGGALFQHNMTMVVDGHTSIEHALPIAHVYDDVVQLWSRTAVSYTPTLGVAYGGLDGEHYFYARTEVWKHPLLTKYVPRPLLEARAVRRETAPEEDFNVIEVARTATKLRRAGVVVNIGAHGQREGLAAHWEMWMLVLGGMTPHEALRAATIDPAQHFGMDREIGSLEEGKLADLVVIDGDVLSDIRQSDRVSLVMLNGRLYDAATMNEVGATPKKRAPFFFERAPGGYVPVNASTAVQACPH